MVILENSDVVLPHYWGKQPDGQTVWQIKWVGIQDRDDVGIVSQRHTGMFTALAGSRDGRYLAWADRQGRLFLWDLQESDEPGELPCEAVVRALCFGPESRTLLAGTDAMPGESGGRLHAWDVRTRAACRPRRTPGAVGACAISPDGRWLAYAVGSEAFIEPLGGG
jgi:WD40 repeat protein